MASELKIKGPLITPSTACASSLSAIGDAFLLIRQGYADLFLVGATEEIWNPITLVSPQRLGVMCNDLNSLQNQKICTPFDSKRKGLVLGEGAGFIIIESEQSLLKWKAKPLAEILAYGMSCDGYNII